MKSGIALQEWAQRKGKPIGDVAAALGLAVRTLAGWRRGWRQDRLRRHRRGRPPARIRKVTRAEIKHVLLAVGGLIGLMSLAQLFPGVSRRALRRLLAAFRRWWASEGPLRLQWPRPGAVWALDFFQPDAPIDGIYPAVLVCRDLGSGYLLAARPVPSMEAGPVAALLEDLFRAHGAPLVVKMDNGSAFISEIIQAQLAAHGVLQLLSPPCLPRYNGSVEAGIGRLKQRVREIAATDGSGGPWTAEDLEAGRLLGNEIPWKGGSSPEQTWHSRTPCGTLERDALWKEYRSRLQIVRSQLDLGEAPLPRREQATVDRISISRALVALGYVVVGRRRIRPPVRPQTAARIS